MPPLKQPTSLEDKAMEVLVNFFCTFCKDHREDLDKLRRGIPFITNENGSGIPPKLAAELYNRVLHKIVLWPLLLSNNGRIEERILVEKTLVRVASEILIDQTIVGLDCPWKILKSLPPDEVNRIRGITRLNLEEAKYDTSWNSPHYSLDDIHLEHLTVFEYPNDCIDWALRLLSENCPMLKHVDVSYSGAVTDLGLACLASCTNLQYLGVTSCKKVSTSCLNHLLSVNKLLRQLEAWHFNSKEAGFDFRKDATWEENLSVHDSLESFTIVESFTDRHLLHLVRRFPNLRSIKITAGSTVNFSIIKSLSKLAKIEYDAGNGSRWADFESVLELIGPQIAELKVYCQIINTMQQSIDSIFQLCENLEVLDIVPQLPWHSLFQIELVVPPFKNLRVFCFLTRRLSNLELGVMPKLERLLAFGNDWGQDRIKSIIFDHTNFPNLKEIYMRRSSWKTLEEDKPRLEQIIKTNNLDIMIGISSC